MTFTCTLFINGEACAASSAATFSRANPVSGDIATHAPAATLTDAIRTADAAAAAFPQWRDTPPGERRRLLLAAADQLEQRHDQFVAAMNAKARQLGMGATRFSESTGLDPHNVSSARDLGILVRTASQYGLIRQFSTTPTYDFNLGYRVLKSNNTNALVRNGGWNINISKTGYINEAGRCVVMHATVNSRPAVVVLLGAPSSQSRTNDATNLLSWLSTLPKRV